MLSKICDVQLYLQERSIDSLAFGHLWMRKNYDFKKECCFARDMRKSNMNNITKAVWAVSLLVVVIGLAVSGCGQGSKSDNSSTNTKTSVDPNPTGTWTAGDRNSVYNRLAVRSSGTFSFETVDFTGDVKGGYSGSWERKANSIRFKWDGGSCSGRRSGRNNLVFGSTMFSR